MTTIKEFSINTRCSESELASRVNAGWQIQFMQFMQDGTLHVVFCRDVAAPAPAAPTVEVVQVDVKPIESVKLPAHMCIVGLGEPARSVPLTHNKAKGGDTRPVNVPRADPVMAEAARRSKETFNRARAEGQAAVNQVSSRFNFKQ